ncbi:class II aldolase/adducin family protein [Mesorhizobium sp. XAP10]|uniref:class II aldolase/adducin family protein n=1 Tax=unclassified Mesorhizobium TaxID=325217 RepID=UPI0023DF939C|nr:MULTISPECIES: class II aldolase/adducin family protein [unclassified Mesorhizobium]MDF3156572.1 class II aldolase/adducin family protein [Mesorhizobium sp. XAP10]MDF3249473.1 class II aldolase/adducin family protein [Mesorhizobium sp. XAP4]
MAHEMKAEDFSVQGGHANISKEEWEARVDLAALYRLANIYGYDDLIWNHITMRVPGTDHQFLLNRFGLLYNEVTASNLIKVDEQGKVLYGPPDVNTAGFVIHSAIHNTQHDMKVVFHSHAPAGLAITALQDGLEFLTQDGSMLWGDIGYHDWEGLSLTLEERDRLAKNIEGKKCLIMKNHGFLAVGATAGEAFMNLYYTVRACRVLIDAYSTGLKLDKSREDIWRLAHRQYDDFPLGKYEWPALLRQCDRVDPSYRY